MHRVLVPRMVGVQLIGEIWHACPPRITQFISIGEPSRETESPMFKCSIAGQWHDQQPSKLRYLSRPLARSITARGVLTPIAELLAI
jgi:hypothetical protein